MATSNNNPSIWFTAPGRVEVRAIEVPEPHAGEVLIRTTHTLISGGTELSLFAAHAEATSAWSEFARFPRQVGYSHAGVVTSVGRQADASWMGRRVATRGPHAAWVTRPVQDLRPIPRTVPGEEATFATLAGVVMNGLRRLGLTWGQSVAVMGLGIVGQMAVRAAAVAGAGPVIGIERSPLRLSKLPRIPCVHGLQSGSASHLQTQIAELNSARKLDVVIEASGQATLIADEIQLLREQGKLLLLSSPREAAAFHFHDFCNRPSITIVGAHGFSQPAVETPDNPWTNQRHRELFLQWLAEERLSVNGLITHRFSYQRALEAYQLLAERPEEALGVIFEWPHDP